MPEKKRPDPLKAVGVVRVSTDKQDIGADAQRSLLRVWCVQNDIEMVEVTESRISGAKAKRKIQLQELAVRARELGAGLLIAVDWDRFARSKHFFTHLEEACEVEGIRPVTVEGGLEESPLLRDIKQALAEQERRDIVKRNRRRVAECKKQGRTHGGHVPFGWRRKEGGLVGTRNTVVELEMHPDEQSVLDKALGLRKLGNSYRAVCDELNEDKVLHIRGNLWDHPKLIRILKRERGDKL